MDNRKKLIGKLLFTMAFSLSAFTSIWAQLCDTKFEAYKNARQLVFVNESNLLLGFGNYYWNFGDGSQVLKSDEYQVDHLYAQAGKYNVCLYDSTCSTIPKYCDSIVVPNTKMLTAKFGHIDFGNGAFYFLDSSIITTSPITTYYWDFGDDEFSSDKNTKHNYRSSGDYFVSLTVLDSNNNYDIFYYTVTAIVNAPCYADFKYDYINNEFQFQNLSSTPDTSVTYKWMFGDGSNADFRKNPNHKFNNVGSYTVTLVMTSATCIDSIKQIVNQPDTTCNLNFSTSLYFQKAEFTINGNLLNPVLEKYTIDFGDFNTEGIYGNSITHIYEDTGSYRVCVVSPYNNCGIPIMSCDTVRITSLTAICKANFEVYSNEYSAVVYNSSRAYGSSIPSNITIRWGDGIVYSGIDSGAFFHNYTAEGTYTVTLIMNNPSGCIDSISKLVSVGPNYTLSGKITQNNLPAYFSSVNIYAYDSASSLIYYYVTTHTDENGDYLVKLKKGFYLVQADFAFDPFGTGFFLPTYYKNKLNWDLEDVLYVNTDKTGIDIALIPYAYDSSGSGNISGLVRYGNGVVDHNGPIQSGKPAAKMLLYLLNEAGKTVAYTHTDAEGAFKFDNLPTGNYKVWGEMAGKQTVPAYVNLNDIVNTVGGVKIIIGKNTLSSTQEEIVSVKESNPFIIYPNPTTGNVKIEWKSANQKPVSIQISDITGKILVKENVIADFSMNIDLSIYQNGLYFVQLNSLDGSSIVKRIMKQD